MLRKTGNRRFTLLVSTVLVSVGFIIFSEMWFSKVNSRTRLQTVEVLLKQKQETLLASYRSYREQLGDKDNEIEEISNRYKLAEARILNLSLNLETQRNSAKDLPVIYAITPTYARSQQKAELTRLSQTFLHMSSFHWIVVEDSSEKSRLVAILLRNCGVSYTHLCVLTPSNSQLNISGLVRKSKGVEQRNLGISWLRKNVDPETQPGVVYFADDDNTYDLGIFAEMRRTRKVSVWPVAFVGGKRYEAPIVKNGKVTGWRVSFDPSRKFAIDMAGFAMNLRLFFEQPDLQFSHYARPGSQESYIISKTNITLNDLEPLADNCTKVLVWHTRTLPPELRKEEKMKVKFDHGSNFIVEV
ncbi:galactosylgalactosylxylosylprotein 3-beta-glucuronosyltransferase 1-like [Haliotis rufescens]|uniref:galactosylgalactosylxylosylprotein 3-beta-glucuronosyltransferase 1-like n=1 Tax=Haliotis rufescens TaxID=6454 RepID=UPI00201F49BB|nr:galactosylgalactosylxylosylprotein 3-beta-glucuronosyltransferase 1-like [Haliotis rufescens]